MIVSEYFSPVLAGAGVIDYFIDSNFAGKLVIFVLVFLNCWAIAIMLNKFFDLKKIRQANARDEKRINQLTSMADYDDANFAGRGVPIYKSVLGRWRQLGVGARDGKVRMNYVENAISRAVTEFEDRYEKICIGWPLLFQVPHFGVSRHSLGSDGCFWYYGCRGNY